MKKLITTALVAVLLLSLAVTLTVGLSACSANKDPDKLYVGLECAYSPFNYTQRDDSNDAVQIYNTNYKPIARSYANGYDVMIAKQIAESLGKELVVVKMDFNALIPAVKAGTVDLIIAGMSPTAERKKEVDFSDAYYQSNLVLVVRKDGDFADKTSLAEFGGATIAAQQGTFHYEALKAEQTKYNYTVHTPLADFPALINALNTKAIDAYVAEEPGAIENCASNDAFTYIKLVNNVTGFVASDEDTAIAVGLKKNNTLLAQINEILASISQEQRNQFMNEAIRLASGVNVLPEE